MVVRYNTQSVQYSARVVIVRYRTTSKRLFTQQVLFIIHLSIIQHFYIMCWIVYPRHQYKIKLHATPHQQNNIFFITHKPTYNSNLYKTTHPQLLSIPLDNTIKPCYTTNQTSVRCLADFQHLQQIHKLKYKLNKLIYSNHTRSNYHTYINTYTNITRQYISYYHTKLDPNYYNQISACNSITYNYTQHTPMT